MILRMKGLLIILSHFLRVNPIDSFSSPFPELVDAAVSGQGNLKARDDDVTPQSNGADDFLADSILSSTGPPTSLVNQLPQSPSDVPLLAVGIDQPSTLNDQSNPLEPSDSKSLALDTGDIPTLPAIPFIGGSGEMNYGPNIFEQIQQMWQNPFDVHNQPKPECKQRRIPSGEPSGREILAKMFAMCCGPIPKITGPGGYGRLRVPWRRIRCTVWAPTEKCIPSSIHCCYCKTNRGTGFECEKYYTDQGVPAAPAPNPGRRLKRNAIPMTRRQDDIVANGALPTVDDNDPMSVIAGTLPPQPATAEDDANSDGIAMEAGGTGAETTPKPDASKIQRLAEWTCTAEYERNMGGTPRSRTGPGTDTMQPPPYEEWDPTDENEDDYSDMIVPDNLRDDFYWSP